MVRCPICEFTELIVVLGDGSGACMRCGCTWHQEGSAQRQVRPNPSNEWATPHPRISSLELGIALVSRLVEEHHASVLDYDMGDGGGTIRVRVPAPTIHERLAMILETAARLATRHEELAATTRSLRESIARGLADNERLRWVARSGLVRARGWHTLAAVAGKRAERRGLVRAG